jgi:phospholipase C
MNAKNVSRGILAAVAILTLALGITGCQGVKASSTQSAPSISSFTASSSTVAPGGSVTLSWATTNATSVSITNVSGTLTASGSATVNPTATITYTLTATGSGGQTATMSVTVTVNANAPTVALTANGTNPATVRAGNNLSISWTTTKAVSITFSPTIPLPEEQTFTLPSGTATFLAQSNGTTTTTVVYTATVTGSDGSTSTGSVTVTVLPPLPVISFFTATPTSLASGASTTLSWNTQNATSFSIVDQANNPVGANLAASGTLPVSPTANTTYTATATGGDGSTVQQSVTVTVSFITLTANPTSIAPGQTSMLTWSSPNANSVSIDNGIGAVTPAKGGSVTTPPLSATTTFTATARDINNNPFTATATVSIAGLKSIKHIVFFVQENRSFDNYFGRLGPYRAGKGFGQNSDIQGFCFLCDGDPTLAPSYRGRQHRVSLFHERTEKTHNLTPSWNESHNDIDGTLPCRPLSSGQPTSNCKMDNYPIGTGSIPEGISTDPNGDRAVGYYDESDLPYYYELASQFATSDSWFSPVMANTVANRLYLFSGTSHGFVFPPSTSAPDQFTWPTIFDAMDKTTDPDTGKPVTWKYYYLDSSVFLAQWSTWDNLTDRGQVRCIDEWFNDLSQPNADQLLPDVVFIERGGSGVLSTGCANSATAVDEHPDNNIQNGAAETQKIINALMNSPVDAHGNSAWKNSVFILTFDEGGGLADHVPPFVEPAPDSIAPVLRAGDHPGDFTNSGFRVPLIVISPWTKPHFVSHMDRDTTAILKLIEQRFGVPPLTARDAAQADMTEFFDFANPTGPPSLTAPGGLPWTQELPTQPTCVPNSSPCDDQRLETHP